MACMTSSSKSGFKVMSWPITKEACWSPGPGGPAGSAAEAAIRMFCSSTYGSVTVAGLSQRAPFSVHKQCGQLGHRPVELLEGLCDAAHGTGGVYVSKPCLRRVGVVVG
jgi:hypothetical protein